MGLHILYKFAFVIQTRPLRLPIWHVDYALGVEYVTSESHTVSENA